MVVVFGKVHLATGKKGTKSHSRVARLLTAIAATLRVRDGLKMSVVVGESIWVVKSVGGCLPALENALKEAAMVEND